MAELVEKSEVEKVLYRVDKYGKDLERLPLEEHGAVVNILTQLLNHRLLLFQQAQKQAAVEMQKANEREAKFAIHAN